MSPFRVRLATFAAAVLFATIGLGAPPAASAAGFSYDLYRSSEFSTQLNSSWCVSAVSQMAFNTVRNQADHSYANQLAYYNYGRTHRRYAFNEAGLDPTAQVAILRYFGGSGFTGYHEYAAGSVADALKTAATRMRATGKPVSLFVGHAGNHDWMMTGFTATADPAKTSSFSVTGVWVFGPYWPTQQYYRGVFDSPPHSYFAVADMGWIMGPYSDAAGATIWDGKRVIVTP